MMLNYRAGTDWVVAVHRDVLLAVAGESAFDDAAALWPSLGSADSTSVVLERLTSRGLSATPSFVLVSPAGADALRVIARGAVDVTVDAANDVVVSGRHAATWQERTVQGAAGIRFGSEEGSGPALPFLGGIVSAASAAWAIEAEADASAVMEPSVEDTVVVPRRAAATAPIAVQAEELLASEESVSEKIVTEQVDLEEAADQQLAEAKFAEETIVDVDESARDDAPSGAADDTVVAPEIGPISWIEESVSTSIDLPPFISGSKAGATASASGPAPDPAGDHDGLTIMGDDVRRLLDGRAATAAAAPATPSPQRPTVAKGTQPATVRILLPSGAREPIEHDVIVGRAPSVSKVSGSRIPRLVTVGADDPDISRNHVQISLEGDTVVVTDLNSRNGTMLAYPGKTPQKLRAGESTTVLVGTVIDLGGGITLQVVSD